MTEFQVTSQRVLSWYISLMPILLTGIINMLWVKKGPDALRKALDGERNWRDGRRIFGDNKTWLGFIGYILWAIVLATVWGAIAPVNPGLEQLNLFYVYHENTVAFNLLIGFLLGLAYALFELPNSFLKRRLDISPGKPARGLLKIFFILLDQADSIIGCVLVLALFYPLSLPEALLIILLGAATHIVLNLLLYLVGLRRNPL